MKWKNRTQWIKIDSISLKRSLDTMRDEIGARSSDKQHQLVVERQYFVFNMWLYTDEQSRAAICVLWINLQTVSCRLELSLSQKIKEKWYNLFDFREKESDDDIIISGCDASTVLNHRRRSFPSADYEPFRGMQTNHIQLGKHFTFSTLNLFLLFFFW